MGAPVMGICAIETVCAAGGLEVGDVCSRCSVLTRMMLGIGFRPKSGARQAPKHDCRGEEKFPANVESLQTP